MTTMPLTFTKGTPEHYEEYKHIFDNCSLLDHYGKNPDVDVLQKWLYPYLLTGNVIIANNSQGEPVGLMTYHMNAMFGTLPYLGLLGVSEKYRGEGVGSSLIDVFTGICREAGYKQCFICVSSFNPRAKKLYLRKGFKQIGRIDNFSKQGISESVLMKELY